MIGQIKLVEKLKTLTLSNLPHSIMLVGKRGCGKHLFCKQLSTNLGIQMVDISENLDNETIASIYDSKVPQLYVIDGSKITVKEESVILKFLEEPSKTAFIVILCTNKGKMLNTILNRCVIWDFVPYTRDELLQINPTASDELLSVAHTPGDIIAWKSQPISEVIAFSNKVLTLMNRANLPNALTIPTKVDLKGEGVGYNKDLFIEALKYSSYKLVLDNQDKLWYNIYTRTNKFVNDLEILHIDTTKLFERYILDIKSISKGEMI